MNVLKAVTIAMCVTAAVADAAGVEGARLVGRPERRAVGVERAGAVEHGTARPGGGLAGEVDRIRRAGRGGECETESGRRAQSGEAEVGVDDRRRRDEGRAVGRSL